MPDISTKERKKLYSRRYRIINAAILKEKYVKNKAKYSELRKLSYAKNAKVRRQAAFIYARKHVERVMFNAAKARAKRRGLDFNITIDDIFIPKYCPVLGIELKMGIGYAKEYSPSLDRIDPSKGYIKGNIVVVSYKVNTIKSNATINELEQVLTYYKNLEVSH